jgi:hypothetical protein
VDNPDSPVRWEVHPFLFRVEHPKAIRLDWENTELRWIAPQALVTYSTVPALAETLAQVYPP